VENPLWKRLLPFHKANYILYISLLCRVNFCRCLVCIVVILCVFVVLCVHCCFFCTLDAGLLARSQYSEGPATGHLDTGFLLVSLCL